MDYWSFVTQKHTHIYVCVYILMIDGLLQEKTLEIEYIKAVTPRKEEEPSLHDDWVSAVDGSNDRYAFRYDPWPVMIAISVVYTCADYILLPTVFTFN